MQPIRRQYLDARYGQLHLRLAAPLGAAATGARRPLLCFHLSPVSGAIYENLLLEMGRDRFAIAPDTPGYGASDPPRRPPEIADYAAAMGDMMDLLGFETADCLGYHTGSKIALELALQRPDAIKHLVLISTPVYTPEEAAQMHREFAPMQIADDGSHLTQYWNELMRWRGPGQTAEMVMRYYPDHMRGGDVRHWGHRAAFNFRYDATLPRATQPILVINTNDDLVQYTPRARPLLKNGRILDLPDWGHGFLDLHTVEFAAILREFLDA